jgi:phosphoribosylformylglycinamidine cyclo-ligase
MVAVVRAEEAARAVDQLEAVGESPIRMGRIEAAGASH